MTNTPMDPAEIDEDARWIKDVMAVRRLEMREDSATRRSVFPALYVGGKSIIMVTISRHLIPYIPPSIMPHIRGHWGL